MARLAKNQRSSNVGGLAETAEPRMVQSLQRGLAILAAFTPEAQAFGLGVHLGRPLQRPTSGGSTRRSTTWPFFRCESTISSMSSLSTKVYQTASG